MKATGIGIIAVLFDCRFIMKRKQGREGGQFKEEGRESSNPR
jgi:hypothetical protein